MWVLWSAKRSGIFYMYKNIEKYSFFWAIWSSIFEINSKFKKYHFYKIQSDFFQSNWARNCHSRIAIHVTLTVCSIRDSVHIYLAAESDGCSSAACHRSWSLCKRECLEPKATDWISRADVTLWKKRGWNLDEGEPAAVPEENHELVNSRRLSLSRRSPSPPSPPPPPRSRSSSSSSRVLVRRGEQPSETIVSEEREKRSEQHESLRTTIDRAAKPPRERTSERTNEGTNE